MGLSKYVPLWIKCPVAVLIQQIGQLPLRVIGCNMVRSYIQNSRCSEAAAKRALKTTHNAVYQYLAERYGLVAKRVLGQRDVGVCDDHMPIWVFWWQGRENAPYIIRSCLDHICKNAGNHPVRVVDATNFQSYATIPSHILEKFQNKKISITHLSDYLRVNLLSKYGGLWIDGSIFVRKQIPEEVFQQPIWTIRNPGKDPENISEWNWTIGVLGGWRGNAMFCAVEELLSCYWKDHDILADYFVMDYMMKLVYDSSSDVQEWIHTISPSNEHFYFLQNHANQWVKPELYQQRMDGDTWMYKISWKGQYLLSTTQGKDTVYAWWRRDYGLPSEAGEC